jgi:hypothetical protein
MDGADLPKTQLTCSTSMGLSAPGAIGLYKGTRGADDAELAGE